MEQRLASPPFTRVHRSLIVNMDRVVELEPLFKGEYVLRMSDGRRLTTGRSYRAQVRRAFGLDQAERPGVG
jgi:DNA-binding LytR/AlgR family response regulator